TARYGVSIRNPWLDASESELRELKEALKKYDVTFFGFRAANNLIHPDLSERKKIHRWLIEQCEASERLEAPSVTTAVGSCSPVSATTIHKDNWTWDTWKLSVKVIRQILKDTAGMKVALGIEALNLTNINNPRAHLQLIEDVGDSRCKVTIDLVNMINLGTYFRTTELINECFDLLGEHIIVADAKETYVLPNKMSAYITQVVPGKGILDYETYLVRLSRLSYPRSLLIEGIAEKDYPEAKKYIEETAAKVGVKIYGVI
ncbi:MAG TPA: sugar phosphate isomerase/epimerase, partial [bacterium]|nr:sugar phosphate isomerase/epimerase [bacterium]